MNEEKQIEEMARAMCRNIDADGNCGSDGTACQLECVYGCCAVRLFKAGYRKQAWISVEDALPQSETERVLVFLKDADFTKPIGVNKIDTDRYVGGVWVRWGRYVTHWTPLPDPPKGEEHE